MAEIKLTKNELRAQQIRLAQLEKYLPTLQLKKAMLQAEVQEVRLEIERLQKAFNNLYDEITSYSSLLSTNSGLDFSIHTHLQAIRRRYENIAGVEVPYLEGVDFSAPSYHLVDTPPWVDLVLAKLRSLVEAHASIIVAIEKKIALDEELRQVSIRVNLFEKILIPRALKNIKKIRVFLGDQQLAAVSRAKVAKKKIEERRQVLKDIYA